MPSVRPITDRIRSKFGDIATALDNLQDSLNLVVKDLGGVIRKDRGRVQLNLTEGVIQTLSDRHLDRYSSDRIQIQDADIVGMAATKVTGSFTTVDSGSYSVSGTQVVSGRATGWTAATGTADRTTFVTSTVTLEELAERVKALIDDLSTHGLIGT